MDTELIPMDGGNDCNGLQPSGGTALDELIPQDSMRARAIAAAVAVVLALVSFFVIGPWAGSVETYADTIASLDEKKAAVTSLIGGSTGTSAALTLLPGDVGTPLAEKLLDLGADFAIVIGAIYLEKYLLTILGLAAFRVLVPLACILFAIAMLLQGRPQLRGLLLAIGARLALFGLAIFLAVPASVFVSDQIEATYQSTVGASLAAAEEAQAAEEAAQNVAQAEQDQSLLDMIQQIPEQISTAASGVSKEAQNALNSFIETLAVMIVTSCVIPILVLLFFLWLAKTILGVRIDIPQIRPGVGAGLRRRGR